MRKTMPAHARPPVAYPTRDGYPKPACDADRRRFLRQIALGAGACCFGLPKLGHAQSLPIDFDKLSHHPGAPLADSAAEAAPADRADDSLEQAMAADAPTSAPTSGRIQEDRALWVEPGYLVLIRWWRPDGDNAPVAALEGAANAVQAFLAARVTRTDELHNIDLLHPIEQELVALLQPVVAPAEIAVLHLDHDCRTVCAALDPGTAYPEVIEVMGDVPAPGWE